jgi:hypothetical protein
VPDAEKASNSKEAPGRSSRCRFYFTLWLGSEAGFFFSITVLLLRRWAMSAPYIGVVF